MIIHNRINIRLNISFCFPTYHFFFTYKVNLKKQEKNVEHFVNRKSKK